LEVTAKQSPVDLICQKFGCSKEDAIAIMSEITSTHSGAPVGSASSANNTTVKEEDAMVEPSRHWKKSFYRQEGDEVGFRSPAPLKLAQNPVALGALPERRNVTRAEGENAAAVAAAGYAQVPQPGDSQETIELKRVNTHLTSLQQDVSKLQRMSKFHSKQIVNNERRNCGNRVIVHGFEWDYPSEDMRCKMVTTMARELKIPERDIRDIDAYYKGKLGRAVEVEFRNEHACQHFLRTAFNQIPNGIPIMEPEYKQTLTLWVTPKDGDDKAERLKIFKTGASIIHENVDAGSKVQKSWRRDQSSEVEKFAVDGQMIAEIEFFDDEQVVRIFMTPEWDLTFKQQFPSAFFGKWAPWAMRKQYEETEQGSQQAFDLEEKLLDEYPWDIKMVPSTFENKPWERKDQTTRGAADKGKGKGKGRGKGSKQQQKGKGSGKGKAKASENQTDVWHSGGKDPWQQWSDGGEQGAALIAASSSEPTQPAVVWAGV